MCLYTYVLSHKWKVSAFIAKSTVDFRPPYWWTNMASIKLRATLRQITQKRCITKTWDLERLFMYWSSTTFSCSWLFSLNGFEFIFFRRDSEYDLHVYVTIQTLMMTRGDIMGCPSTQRSNVEKYGSSYDEKEGNLVKKRFWDGNKEVQSRLFDRRRSCSCGGTCKNYIVRPSSAGPYKMSIASKVPEMLCLEYLQFYKSYCRLIISVLKERFIDSCWLLCRPILEFFIILSSQHTVSLLQLHSFVRRWFSTRLNEYVLSSFLFRVGIPLVLIFTRKLRHFGTTVPSECLDWWKDSTWFARAWKTPWKTARSLKTPWKKWFCPWKLLEFLGAVLEFYEKVLEYLRLQQNKFILTSKD